MSCDSLDEICSGMPVAGIVAVTPSYILYRNCHGRHCALNTYLLWQVYTYVVYTTYI